MKRLIRFLKLWRASVFPFATRTQKAWSVALAIMGLAGPILKWWSNLTWLSMPLGMVKLAYAPWLVIAILFLWRGQRDWDRTSSPQLELDDTLFLDQVWGMYRLRIWNRGRNTVTASVRVLRVLDRDGRPLLYNLPADLEWTNHQGVGELMLRPRKDPPESVAVIRQSENTGQAALEIWTVAPDRALIMRGDRSREMTVELRLECPEFPDFQIERCFSFVRDRNGFIDSFKRCGEKGWLYAAGVTALDLVSNSTERKSQ